MQISKISLPIIKSIRGNTNQQIKTPNFGLTTDTFIRNSQRAINDDKSFDEFVKFSQRNGFVKRKSLKGDLIGRGDEAKVYKIDGTNKWVIKQYNRSELIPARITEPTVSKLHDISPELNIGQAIAEVNTPINSTFAAHHFILKKQEGKPIGIPVELSTNFTAEKTKRYLNSLHTLANAPESTYDKLVKDIKYIDEQGLKIKAGNPSNVLYDEKEKQLNFIDVNDYKRDDKPQQGEVLYTILGGKYGVNYMNNNTEDKDYEKAVSDVTAIATKFFKAMTNNGLKFENGKYFNRLLHSKTLNAVLDADTLEEKKTELRNKGLMN